MRNMKTSGHVFYDCHYHLVFCTKYRRKVLTDDVESDLRELLRSMSTTRDDFDIEELEIMPDHVHILMSVDPRVDTHKVIAYIKGNTAHALRRDHPWLKSRIPSLWTRSYFIATTGGASLSKIRKYIQNQKRSPE